MAIGSFSYGFDEDPLLNYGSGGAIGSQVKSQTGGSGAGIDANQPVMTNSLMTTNALDPELDPNGNPPPEGPPPPNASAPPPAGTPPTGSSTGSGGGDTSGAQDKIIGSNLDYLKDYYSKNFGRDIKSDETNDAKRAWELGIPIDQYISRAGIDDRLSNMTNTATQLRTASPANAGVLRDQLARQVTQTLQQQGHEVSFEDDGTMLVDGRPYTIAGDDVAGMNSWMPSGKSTYKPGEIGMGDIPNFSFDDLMKQLATPEVDDFIQKLLANPESMNAHVTDTMKAQSKDELADQQLQQEDDMHSLASQYGFEESPWEASQILSSRQNRNQSVVAGNRAIDMQAAATNMADRRAAAGIGLTYAQNKQSKVFGAVSAALDRSAAIGDRLALRESVNQQAAALGLQAQQLMAQHIQFKLDDLTKRYGIDVSKEISYAQLEQADRHHQEDLAMQLKQLGDEMDRFSKSQKQQDDQYKSDHELELEKQRHNQEIWDWAIAHPGEGAPGGT